MEWSDISDTEIEEELPGVIQVVKIIRYDVEHVLSAMQMDGEFPNPTIDDVLNVVAGWASEDFGCQWGHPTDVTKLMYLDDLGNSLYVPEEE
jgi:hypothetical protein